MATFEIPDIDEETLKRHLSESLNPEARNRRIYSTTLKVRFDGNTPPGEWDDRLMGTYVRLRVERVLKAVLEEENPGWNVTVEMQVKLLMKKSNW